MSNTMSDHIKVNPECVMFGSFKAEVKSFQITYEELKFMSVAPNKLSATFEFHIKIPINEIREMRVCNDPTICAILIRPIDESARKIQEYMQLDIDTSRGYAYNPNSLHVGLRWIIVVLPHWSDAIDSIIRRSFIGNEKIVSVSKCEYVQCAYQQSLKLKRDVLRGASYVTPHEIPYKPKVQVISNENARNAESPKLNEKIQNANVSDGFTQKLSCNSHVNANVNDISDIENGVSVEIIEQNISLNNCIEEIDITDDENNCTVNESVSHSNKNSLEKDSVNANESNDVNGIITKMDVNVQTNQTFNNENDRILKLSQNIIINHLNTLLFNPNFSDCKITVNGNNIPAHKAILSSHSSVFSKIFKEENQITIDDIKEEAIREMLRFIYTGECHNIKEIAIDLFNAAKRFNMQLLRELCINSIKSQLANDELSDCDVISEIANFARKNDLNDLKLKAIDSFKFIQRK